MIVIPPAWTEVWICPVANGHIQATGRDARGRKQYRYHLRWREHRDATKYGELEAFGRALPQLRRRVTADLKRSGLPREKVLAAIVRLLETTMIRIGNDEYARANRSYGLTTLLDRHVHFSKGTMRFEFRGKSGITRKIELKDAKLARIVKRCQDLPGQHLFQYLDDDGCERRIGSGDVNDYLRSICGTAFTAKYFRTWQGTLQVMHRLSQKDKPESETEAKREIKNAITEAAVRLGNTPAVCRKHYVHPVVFEAYRAGTLEHATRERALERALMRLLRSARLRARKGVIILSRVEGPKAKRSSAKGDRAAAA